MNTRVILIILVALGIFAFINFSEPAANTGNEGSTLELQEPGIRVSGITTSVGQGSSEYRQTISYTATLQNAETSAVYIQTAEALVASDIKPRITGGDTIINVEQEVPAGETIEISGQIEFNSEALSKNDIDAISPLLTGFRINSYRVILVP